MTSSLIQSAAARGEPPCTPVRADQQTSRRMWEWLEGWNELAPALSPHSAPLTRV